MSVRRSKHLICKHREAISCLHMLALDAREGLDLLDELETDHCFVASSAFLRTFTSKRSCSLPLASLLRIRSSREIT